jgi:phage tail protein X
VAVSGFELWRVESDFVTADLIVWRRYRNSAPGIVEQMLDANPQLAFVHRVTPFIPPGVYVRVPIDLNLMAGKPTPMPQDALWTDRAGYRI